LLGVNWRGTRGSWSRGYEGTDRRWGGGGKGGGYKFFCFLLQIFFNRCFFKYFLTVIFSNIFWPLFFKYFLTVIFKKNFFNTNLIHDKKFIHHLQGLVDKLFVSVIFVLVFDVSGLCALRSSSGKCTSVPRARGRISSFNV